MRSTPLQPRSSLRIAQFLDVAADILTEVGFDAMTMTAIADRSGASIGALYRWFPDKDSIAHELRTQYRQELDSRLREIFAESRILALPEFSQALIDGIVEFTRQHPAWLPLLATTSKPARDPDARKLLRDDFARIFRDYDPSISEARAFLIATVSLEIVKGLIGSFRHAAEGDRKDLIREFKLALSLYLSASLAG